MADEVQNLILKIIGDEKLSVLNAELDKEAKLIKQATADLREMTISEQQFEAVIMSSYPKLEKLNGEIKNLSREAKQFSGQGGIQLAYVMDDLANTSGNWQRHLASISNNMPGLLQSMGVGAGLAGQLSLVYTGFVVALPIIQKFFDSITGQSPDAVAALEKIKKAAEEAAAAFNKAVEKPTGGEEESGKALQSLVAGPQGRQIQDALVKAAEATKTGAVLGETPEDIDQLPLATRMAIKGFDAIGDTTASQGIRRDNKGLLDQIIADRVKRERLGYAQTAFGEAFEGKTRQERQKGLMTIQGLHQARPDFFPPGFGSELAHSTEQGIAADAAESDADQAALDDSNRQWEATKKAAQATRKAAKAKAAADEKIRKDNERLASEQQAGLARFEAKNKREGDQAQRQLNREAAARQRARAVADRAEAKEAPIRQMQDFVGQNSDANPAQAREIAENAVRMMEQTGVPAMVAAQSAYLQLQQRLMRLEQQLQGVDSGFRRANNRQLGQDNFSFQSPMPGQ
jgi:hypothetical protein